MQNLKHLLKGILLVTIFMFSSSTHSQDFLEIPWADKETVKKAKKQTKKAIDSLKPILKLKALDKRLRNFDLEECDRKEQDTDSFTYSPAGYFPVVSGCPGLFVYHYRQKDRNVSHYSITFFYDEKGNLVDQEIFYSIITH